MLFKEIISVYSENHTEAINVKCKSYLMLKWLVHIATIRLERLSEEEISITFPGRYVAEFT
jgi:hypothetical protein